MTVRRTRVATVITRLEGGAGVLALRGARALDPRSYEVTIVTGSGDRLLDEAAGAGLDVVVEPALRAPIAPAHDLLALRRLTRLFTLRGFDVVHTHCAKAGAVGRSAARRAGTGRIVHTYHGFPFHPFQSRLRRSVYLRIERVLGRHTDLAVCVGGGVAVEAIRRGIVRPDRVRSIAVPVDRHATTACPATRARARREIGVPDEDFVIGAVGRLTYQKAPEDFLTALRNVDRPGVTGVWIGDGDLAGRMRRLAAEPGRGPRIVLTGHRADVPDLLPAFDVFVLPSRYEGLPLVVAEAMVCGIPVVATAVNAVPDVVVPGETGMLVPPRRPDLLAAALRHLIEHPAAGARMVAAAHTRIDERFGEAALADTLAAAYAGAPAPPRPDRPVLSWTSGAPAGNDPGTGRTTDEARPRRP